MRNNEAIWINAQLISLGLDKKPTHCLNLGSSTRYYREVQKPYISNLVVQPLSRLGKITNVDAKAEDGVDEVGDFCDENFVERLLQNKYDVILCNNILTHVRCREALFHIISNCIGDGGYVVITAPYIYPYCSDPHDYKYRPSVMDIRRSLSDLELVASTILYSNDTHFYRLIRNPMLLAGLMLNTFLPVSGTKKWHDIISDFPNLLKKFETTGVVMRKNPSSSR